MAENVEAADMTDDAGMASEASSGETTALSDRYKADKRRWLILVLVLQVAVITLCILYMVYDWNTRPKPKVFARNEIGQLVPSKPLIEESIESAALLNWVNEAVVAAYSFNFVNIKEHPFRLNPYFDESGYKRVVKILTRDSHMSRVIKDKLIVSAVAGAAPEVLKEGVYQNRFYVWIIKMPLEVSYSNKGILRRQSLDVEVVVKRVPETDNPIGVRITNFVVKVKSETQPTVNLFRP